MSKIVLFEGLDNCFKTTNVKALFNFWSKQNQTAHVLHYSGVKSLDKNEAQKLSQKLYTEMFETFEYFYDKNINVICDRSHLGENVYSRYRGYDPSYIWKLEEKFRIHEFWNNVYVIFLKDSNIDNVLSRDDGLSLSTKKEDKIFERSKFEEAMFMTSIKNKLTIDVNSKAPEKILDEILCFLKEDDIEEKAKKILNDIEEKLDCYNDVLSTTYIEALNIIIKGLRG
jgi:thymidylate kinase